MSTVGDRPINLTQVLKLAGWVAHGGEAKALIAKYGIQYVFVGSLERSKFSPDQLSKFGSFMDVLKGDPAATIVYKTRS